MPPPLGFCAVGLWDFDDVVDAECSRRERISAYRALARELRHAASVRGRIALDSMAPSERELSADYCNVVNRWADFLDALIASLEAGDGQRRSPRDDRY